MINSKLPKKIYLLVLFGFIVLLSATSYTFYKTVRDAKSPKNIVLLQPDFDKELRTFRVSVLQTLKTLSENDQAASQLNLEKTEEYWAKITNNYYEKQPEKYKNTIDWQDSLNLIHEALIRAKKAANAGRLDTAYAELRQTNILINNIRNENDINDIETDLSYFYEEIQKLKSDPEIAANKEKLLNLKLQFAILKKYEDNENYTNFLLAMEKAISNVDRFSGPDFAEALNSLEPIFLDYYLR